MRRYSFCFCIVCGILSTLVAAALLLLQPARSFAQQASPKPGKVSFIRDIAPIFKEDVAATEQILIRQNAIFNTMNVDMRALYKFLLPLGQPLVGWTGISLAGSARHLAQQSGGEALHMNRASDYGGALAKIIGNLTARYSLGFALGEDEKDDGRMHELALRVKAPDPKGKQRRIDVSSRRGYYMPKHESEQAAATK